MQVFLALSPDTKLFMYTGSKDSLAPPAAMQALADELGADITIFEGRNHSVRDDLPFMNTYIQDKLQSSSE